MRFQITMNMPSRSGNSVHQIIADYPAKNLEDFVDVLTHSGFLVVEEVYKDNEAGKASNFYKVGDIAINSHYVGKVKVLNG